ncbi:MAG: DUF1931 domain-containing protein [Nanoarchaeota archaeon]|nr:DUF1931 domain-containing protein [Nanoarchaeota archaeon]
MTDIIIKSKIKEVVKDLNVAGDFPDALDEVVKELVLKAGERAKANGRRTLQAKDI